MRFRALQAVLPVVLSAACATTPPPALPVDHHAHLESEGAHALMLELADFVGQSLPEAARRSGGHDAGDLIAAMDSAGVDRAPWAPGSRRVGPAGRDRGRAPPAGGRDG